MMCMRESIGFQFQNYFTTHEQRVAFADNSKVNESETEFLVYSSENNQLYNKMGGKQAKPISETNKAGDVTATWEWPAASWKDITSYEVGQSITKEVTVTSETEKDTFDVCLYPHGFNDRTKHDVSLWLKKKNANKELIVELTCSIAVDGDDKELVKKTLREDLVMDSVIGWSSFCSRSVIMNDTFSGLRHESMSLRFRLRVFSPKSLPNPELEDDKDAFLQELSKDFLHLLSDKYLSDIRLQFGQNVIPLHKAILFSRSQVFRRSLSSFLGGIPSTSFGLGEMSTAMQYVYSGSVSNLISPQDSERVYALSRRYGLFGLSDSCRKTINLDVDNVVRILVMAHELDDFELEESCLEYVDKHLRLIKGRPEWIELMSDYPNLADKALFFVDRRTKGGEVKRSWFRKSRK